MDLQLEESILDPLLGVLGHIEPTPARPLAADTPWKDRLALRTQRMTSSAIRELLKLTADPEIISFGGGLPAPEVFPIAEIRAAADRVLDQHGRQALQYSNTEGYLPLRAMLARHMGRYGIHVTPANILITSGAQQALNLVGKLFINSGDRILTEEPTYLGALQAFTSYQAQYLPVPIDDDGLRMDKLEDALRAGPKFMYVLPNFQNPGGVTLSLERRRRLVELAAHYGVPILEDDPYGQLRYEGDHLPALVKLDSELHGSCNGGAPFRGGVIYLGTMRPLDPPARRPVHLGDAARGAGFNQNPGRSPERESRFRPGSPLLPLRRRRALAAAQLLLLPAGGDRRGDRAAGAGAGADAVAPAPPPPGGPSSHPAAASATATPRRSSLPRPLPRRCSI